MSYVTNLILSFSVIENTLNRLKEINSYFEEGCGFVYVEDEILPRGWYGGTKYLEVELFIGAFNYLDEEELINHIKSINFEEPESVQLIIQRQYEDTFSIINVFEEKKC